jgi:uncharacterized protein YhhL (DUF1145 family)
MSQETAEQKQVEDTINYNVVNYKWLRKQNLPYIFIWVAYYAWNIVFATWWTASPLTENVFSTQLRELMHFVNLISSAAFIFIIRKEWFVKTARIGAALIITGMIIFFTVQNANIQTLSAVISSIAMGLVNISILMPFVFTLNNTEKLYALVGSNVLIQLIMIFLEYNANEGVERILSFSLLLASLGAVLFFRKNDVAENVDGLKLDLPKFQPRIYLTLLFNCGIAILCKGAGKGILNIAAEDGGFFVLTGYYIGALAGCILYMLVYAFTKKAYIWLGNIIFSSVTIALLCNAFIPQVPEFAVPFSLLLGLGSTVGIINMYYIIGVVGKKYDSIRYVRLSIFFIGIFGFASGIAVGNMISHVGTFEISISVSILSAAVMIAWGWSSGGPVWRQIERPCLLTGTRRGYPFRAV